MNIQWFIIIENVISTIQQLTRVSGIFGQYRMETSANYMPALMLPANTDWISELDIWEAFSANLKLARKLYTWQFCKQSLE